MVLAFAVENVLKGILIARKPSRVNDATLGPWEGGGHDLIELAKAAKLELTGDEEHLLLTLSVHGEWLGRYPCPIRHPDRLPRPAGDGFGPFGGVSTTDLDLAFSLCDRFKQTLTSLPP